MGKRVGPTPEIEFIEMAKRIAREPEGWLAARDSQTWREFVRDKLVSTGRAGKTAELLERQLEGAERGRLGVYEDMPRRGSFVHRFVLRGREETRFCWRPGRTWISAKAALVMHGLPPGAAEPFRKIHRLTGKPYWAVRHPVTKRFIWAPF